MRQDHKAATVYSIEVAIRDNVLRFIDAYSFAIMRRVSGEALTHLNAGRDLREALEEVFYE